MTSNNLCDYGSTGMTIQQAMVDHAKKYPDKTQRPDCILWDGVSVKTSDAWTTPKKGIVRAEILSANTDVEQGFDIKVDGWLELAKGERVPVLRTWKDERFEDTVEYPFFTRDQRLFVWNVYKMTYPSGRTVEERWTENAGFWVEQAGENERIYHCSHGMSSPPDFESLVFKVSVRAV